MFRWNFFKKGAEEKAKGTVEFTGLYLKFEFDNPKDKKDFLANSHIIKIVKKINKNFHYDSDSDDSDVEDIEKNITAMNLESCDGVSKIEKELLSHLYADDDDDTVNQNTSHVLKLEIQRLLSTEQIDEIIKDLDGFFNTQTTAALKDELLRSNSKLGLR